MAVWPVDLRNTLLCFRAFELVSKQFDLCDLSPCILKKRMEKKKKKCSKQVKSGLEFQSFFIEVRALSLSILFVNLFDLMGQI